MKLKKRIYYERTCRKICSSSGRRRARGISGNGIQMNVTGGFLWECLSEERTKQELIDLFLEKYDARREDAEADVNTFIENLSKAGILEV